MFGIKLSNIILNIVHIVEFVEKIDLLDNFTI